MAGIGFNASQAWNPEVYVKYGIVNRIPCTVSSSYSGTFKNGTVVSISGNYEISSVAPLGTGITGSQLQGGIFGIAVAQNQVDYTNPANLSVSVMIPTPGAVISVPVSCFASGSTPTAGQVVFVDSTGQMTTSSSNSVITGTVVPFAQCIASDQEYIDLIFPLAGMTGTTTASN
ncbi:MAG: hypothetical protein J6S67_18305 [Methanobrevibacter sp.]|nr:hypothetical protein [Methanobrevibacter sp.]